MKKKRHDKSISFCSVTLLLVFHTILFAWLWYDSYHPLLLVPYYRKGNYIIVLLYTAFLLASNQIFGGLRLGYYKVLDSIVARTLSLFTAYGAMYCIISLLSYRLVSIVPIVYAIIIGFLITIFPTISIIRSILRVKCF